MFSLLGTAAMALLTAASLTWGLHERRRRRLSDQEMAAAMARHDRQWNEYLRRQDEQTELRKLLVRLRNKLLEAVAQSQSGIQINLVEPGFVGLYAWIPGPGSFEISSRAHPGALVFTVLFHPDSFVVRQNRIEGYYDPSRYEDLERDLVEKIIFERALCHIPV